MPGQSQHTLESLRKEAVEIAERGVRAFILFAVPARKDPEGSEAWNPDGIGQQAIHALREEFGDEAVVIGDLCLDEYTDHGHCGVLNDRGEVENDATVELYRRIALAQAEAGAHLVGPSGMMDGQVAAIRAALDEGGHQDVGSSPTRRSSHRRSTGPSAKRRRARLDPATGPATSRTPRTPTKRSVRSAPTSPRAPTS